jgi:TPR repeat protein
MYRDGKGVPPNLSQAAIWFRKAADQGSPESQNNLAVLYASGHGVEQDFVEASVWYRKAAENGVVLAQFYLAEAYRTGVGVARDPFAAATWYLKAAQAGHALAQLQLGHAFKRGHGVSVDLEQAAKLFFLAARQNIPEAQAMVGLGEMLDRDPPNYLAAYIWLDRAARHLPPPDDNLEDGAITQERIMQAREVAASTMTPVQLELAQRMVADWKPENPAYPYP